MKENDFLRWIGEQAGEHPRVRVGIGDDMAVVRVGAHRRDADATGDGGNADGGNVDEKNADQRNADGRNAAEGNANERHGDSGDGVVLLKMDQCLAGVHFDLGVHGAGQVGRKAVNRCLSDCAGMGCLPAALMVSVALPREGPGSGEAFARELFLGCREAGLVFDCPLVGGDTAMWDQRLVVTVAAMGVLGAGGRREVRRSGARVGDTLFVSGRLGGSMLGAVPGGGGGRHMTFEPRIRLAQALVKALGVATDEEKKKTRKTGAGGGGLHAMMDLSDGLGQDLPRMCEASGVGAEIYPGRLPVHEDAELLAARDGLPAGLHALADGEDYELLFAVETEAIPEVVSVSEKGGVALTAIGLVTEKRELVLVDEDGRRHGWPRVGWEHRSGA